MKETRRAGCATPASSRLAHTAKIRSTAVATSGRAIIVEDQVRRLGSFRRHIKANDVARMDPEATGWDNIIFRCVFMGLSLQEAKRRSPAIAEFCELGGYLDLPIRTYSAGMNLRLAFAISTSVDPDILIMDEMISAGDLQFIEKAKARLHEVIGKANILALASHDLQMVRSICNKVVWLEHGVIKKIGPSDDVVTAYEGSQAGPT